jgi:hypothetical protein
MGIDIHALKFLMFAARSQPFGRVATMGRQSLFVPKGTLKKLMNLNQEVDYGPFCEELLKGQFRAATVDSFDISGYENATHIVDMNKPLLIEEIYDTIIDGGCIEHVYNAPQALANISSMCAQGGQILHILPANNLCGHGFWQFSPELFFSLYSKVNGYEETQVFLADLTNERVWYEVRKPQNGERAELRSLGRLYVMVRTRRTARFSHESVHQSDFVYHWNRTESTSRKGFSWTQRARDTVKRVIRGSPFALPAARFVHARFQPSLWGAKAHLTKHVADTLI